MARIVLMEDDVPLGLELSASLRAAGHEVAYTKNASEARSALWHWDFDLLITDMIVRKDGKPVADGGLGLISWVRHTALANGFKHLPVIAITGEDSRDWMKFLLPTALRVGADATLVKPIDMDDLLQAIDAQLQPPAAFNRSIQTGQSLR